MMTGEIYEITVSSGNRNNVMYTNFVFGQFLSEGSERCVTIGKRQHQRQFNFVY